MERHDPRLSFFFSFQRATETGSWCFSMSFLAWRNMYCWLCLVESCLLSAWSYLIREFFSFQQDNPTEAMTVLLWWIHHLLPANSVLLPCQESWTHPDSIPPGNCVHFRIFGVQSLEPEAKSLGRSSSFETSLIAFFHYQVRGISASGSQAKLLGMLEWLGNMIKKQNDILIWEEWISKVSSGWMKRTAWVWWHFFPIWSFGKPGRRQWLLRTWWYHDNDKYVYIWPFCADHGRNSRCCWTNKLKYRRQKWRTIRYEICKCNIHIDAFDAASFKPNIIRF